MADIELSNEEYDLLDKLYFTQSFARLQLETGFDETQLINLLTHFQKVGWVKCVDMTTDEELDKVIIIKNPHGQHYVASKKGLQIHNSL